MASTPALAAPENAGANKLTVSQTLPEEANDPLRLWFAEQDKLLDDILIRLARIENLVREIHALVTRLPSGTAATPPAPPTADAPVTTPVAPPVAPHPAVLPKPAPGGIWGFFDEWGSILAGIGLLLLVLMIGQRHRRNQKKPLPSTPTTPPPAHPAANAATPEIHIEEPAFLLEPAVAAKPLAAAPTHSSSPVATGATAQAAASIQRAGAKEPSKGQADQALELAEIMLSMGLGHGAAQTLTEQIRNEPKQALLHWLKLLEIYRQNGQQAEFEKSAEELRQHFNVQPEDWQIRPDTLRSIEDYPHIAARMCELWGRPACLVYLQNLLADNRGGARSGFPQSVAEELLLLTAMLRTQGIAPEADATIDR